ncbi:MAG: MotA/TolQ/ExbB proton channel family protein [Phycisphaerae bacterium]|nr:MotA/TolQ/ExbB proton channel family protein [Phycisphaerae bacterium]
MDLATIVGLLLGFGLVGWSIFGNVEGEVALVFINVPSFLIVIGGAIASVMMATPLARFLKAGKFFSKAVMHKDKSVQKLIEDLVGFAEVARRDGILSLESAAKDADDPFLVQGIQMAVDGTDPELIESIMTSELDSIADRHEQGKSVFDLMGKYAPAYGMIGTLVGLVIMLMNMQDPAAIGPAMAVALITTLYGSMFANMFALPIADKLAVRSEEELLMKSIIIKGIMAIQSGDNPRIVERKLKTFLPPSLRGTPDDEGDA